MIYFRTSRFSKLARIFTGFSRIFQERALVAFKTRPILFIMNKICLNQGFYSPTDPKINPQLCLDMTYPPVKFHVDCSKETQTSSFSKLPRRVHYDIF